MSTPVIFRTQHNQALMNGALGSLYTDKSGKVMERHARAQNKEIDARL
jgi:hypothetical protein